MQGKSIVKRDNLEEHGKSERPTYVVFKAAALWRIPKYFSVFKSCSGLSVLFVPGGFIRSAFYSSRHSLSSSWFYLYLPCRRRLSSLRSIGFYLSYGLFVPGILYCPLATVSLQVSTCLAMSLYSPLFASLYRPCHFKMVFIYAMNFLHVAINHV